MRFDFDAHGIGQNHALQPTKRIDASIAGNFSREIAGGEELIVMLKDDGFLGQDRLEADIGGRKDFIGR